MKKRTVRFNVTIKIVKIATKILKLMVQDYILVYSDM